MKRALPSHCTTGQSRLECSAPSTAGMLLALTHIICYRACATLHSNICCDPIGRRLVANSQASYLYIKNSQQAHQNQNSLTHKNDMPQCKNSDQWRMSIEKWCLGVTQSHDIPGTVTCAYRNRQTTVAWLTATNTYKLARRHSHPFIHSMKYLCGVRDTTSGD